MTGTFEALHWPSRVRGTQDVFADRCASSPLDAWIYVCSDTLALCSSCERGNRGDDDVGILYDICHGRIGLGVHPSVDVGKSSDGRSHTACCSGIGELA